MPRARSPQRDEAYQIWLASNFKKKLKDIAAELNVTESKVRKWKCEDKWEQKAKGTLPNEKGNVPKRKRGAPKGNKNAVGNNGGAPYGNKNSLEHGGYSKFYWDTLSPEEKEMIENMPKDEEELLLDQIKMYSVQERRLLTAIETVKKAQITTKNEKGEEIVIKDRVVSGGGTNKTIKSGGLYNVTETTTSSSINYEHKDNRLFRLQQQLTTVQRAKTKALDSLIHINLEKQKLEMLRDNAETELEDTSETDGAIYG